MYDNLLLNIFLGVLLSFKYCHLNSSQNIIIQHQFLIILSLKNHTRYIAVDVILGSPAVHHF